MTTVQRYSAISKLAFPIGIALSSNLVMSLIDLAMVGRLGNRAIAAVGLSAFSFTLILAFVVGIAPAVQGLIARRRGEGSSDPICLPLNAGLLAALVVGIPLTVVCWFLTPFFFVHVSSDPEVTKIGIPFLRTLYLGIAASGMNNAFKGYWSGLEKPNVYMTIALLMDGLNILVNYILIFGHFGVHAMGATGAAVGTLSALYAGVIINAFVTHTRSKDAGFVSALPGQKLLASIMKLGLPATLQNFFYAAGYVVFLWMVGQVGTTELAAASVLVRIAEVLLLLAMSLGSASATLVSRTVGEGDMAAAAQWGWDTAKLGVLAITIMGMPLFVFPQAFLALFVSDPHTIAMAVLPLRIMAASAGLGSLIYIFAYTLYSVGYGNRVALISFATQWVLFLPAVWIVGPYLHYGLLQIWLVQAVYGALVTVLITALWADGRWKRVKV